LRSAFRAGGQGLEAALSLSYFAELLDAFAQEGEAEDAVYRLAVAVIGAAQGGADVNALARYLEAWLLKLHGIYPPLDRCAGCGGALPTGGLVYHAGAHGFVCAGCSPASGPVLPEAVRLFLAGVFRRPPAEAPTLPAEAGALEPFHRDLITRHLERDLRSHRVLRDAAAGVRG
jgi:recombinational DNA repair protein (RecF pathway)